MDIFIVHIDYWTALGHDEESRYCATAEIAERVKAEVELEYIGCEPIIHIHKVGLIMA